MVPLISVNRLFKEYSENLPEPVRVLQNLNVKISSGEFVCLMGPSGSGKSTLLNLLGLLDSPTNGTIFFEEREISQLTSLEKAKLRNSSFGFIFQGFNLLKKHSVLENVMLPLLYSKVQRGKAAISAKEILDATGLGVQGEPLAGVHRRVEDSRAHDHRGGTQRGHARKGESPCQLQVLHVTLREARCLRRDHT